MRQLNVLFLDSDEEIAQDFENDTRRIFIDQVSGLNRDTALSTVITRETRFLAREHVDPAVIALGPGALNRDGIGNFLARPNTFIVRITIADGVANSRLLRRHNEGPADIVDHVNYGSWDLPQFIQFNGARYILNQEPRQRKDEVERRNHGFNRGADQVLVGFAAEGRVSVFDSGQTREALDRIVELVSR